MTDDPPIRFGVGRTALGETFVARTERGLCFLFFLDEGLEPALARVRRERPGVDLIEDREAVEPFLSLARARIDSGGFGDDPPLDLQGTPFRLRVWDALVHIPAGSTRTYGDLADELGVPGGSRAVGTACGANPVSLFVPCHRVLRVRGLLGGYRWGLERKRALLELESNARIVENPSIVRTPIFT